MKKWRVYVTETVNYTIEVEAETEDEASDIAEELWAQSVNPDVEFNGVGLGIEVGDIREVKDHG